MEPIARTKPNMSVLRRDILPVSPFGILSQAFTEEILGRLESGPGMYPLYGLELLYPEEEHVGETPSGGNVRLEIHLKLILQQLKESGKTPAAEHILKKAETLRLLREKTVARQTPGGAGRTAARRMAAAAGRTLSSRALTPWPGAAGSPGRTAHAQSGAGRMAALAGAERVGGGSYWLGMRSAPAAGAGRRQQGTHAGAAVNRHDWPSGIYAALTRAGSPTVAGLPGQMGRSPAEVRFLTPQEADASGGQRIDREKAAAGLTRYMEQAAAQAAQAVARTMAMEPQGDDHHRHVKQAFSNAEQKIQSSDRLRVEQPHRETGKAAPGRDISVTADHAPSGMTADQSAADTDTTVSGKEMPGGHAFVKERTNSSPDISRIRSTTRDIRTSSGGQIGSLPDMEWTTSGAVGYGPTLRQDKIPSVEENAAASGYLPLLLEHTEPMDIPEQTSLPGQLAPIDEAGRRLAQAIEAAALGVERSLAQSVGDSRREERPAAERKSEAHGGSLETRKKATATFASQAAGMADSDGGHSIRMKRSGSLAEGEEEAVKGTSPFVRQYQPAVDHAMTDRLAVGPLTAGRLPEIGRPAANRPGVLRDLGKLTISSDAIGAENTNLGVDGILTMKEPVPTEQAGQPPLTLEYLQELQKNDRQAVEQIQALPPKVLEKLLDMPGLRLLSKDITVLAAESRERRQPPHRWSQAAGRTAGPTAQAGGAVRSTTSGGTAYRGMSGTAGDAAFSKPSPAGYGNFSQGVRLCGFPRSQNMSLPSVRPSSALAAGGMALPGAAAAMRSHTWSPSAQPPVELTRMEPSLEAQTAGQTVNRREPGVQQEALLKEIQRSLAAGKSGVVASDQSTAQRQTDAGQIASGREIAAGPARAGGRGFPARGPEQLTAVNHISGFLRGRRTGAAPGAAAYGGMAPEALSAYPALSMEYGGPLAVMARELRQTAEREPGQAGAARELGLHTQAARAMGEKGTPESIQTLEVMTQPQIQAQQVVWENPYMRSAPMEMAHHRKNDPQNQQRTQQGQPQVRMSDAEIRRAADKVFKLVQEKIINERRRIGRM